MHSFLGNRAPKETHLVFYNVHNVIIKRYIFFNDLKMTSACRSLNTWKKKEVKQNEMFMEISNFSDVSAFLISFSFEAGMKHSFQVFKVIFMRNLGFWVKGS